MLVDEASQTTEPSCLIPLHAAGKKVQHAILVGDHKQLPPVVQYDQNREHLDMTSISLMQRLIDFSHFPAHLLAIQRRMHSGVSAFANAAFYGGSVTDGTDDAKVCALCGIGTVEFRNVGAEHGASESGGGGIGDDMGASIRNPVEARAVVSDLRALIT